MAAHQPIGVKPIGPAAADHQGISGCRISPARGRNPRLGVWYLPSSLRYADRVTDVLAGWNDGAARQAVVEFVERTVSDGVPAGERVAVFDNDGTLWCEKPMPVQFDFILRRLSEMAQADPGLRDRQPWKAAYERDYGWFGTVITEHYAGNDANVGTLLAGIFAAYGGISVEEFEAKSGAFLRSAQHPTLGRGYLECVYVPMVELLGYLAANGFANYIVSGGGRDFMRPVSQEAYGIPRDRVIGSTATLRYTSDDRGGTITHNAEADYLDDGPQKPIRIWSHAGRRPLLAAGNSNGDIPMLDFTQHPGKPSLRLLLLHDDDQREFAYTSGAEQALERAGKSGWTIVSIKNDWATVF
jgi:phosphoglycolate phosphatase-like HAD superfamily hydrolase